MKLFQKTLSLVLTLLIAMQSMQITIFANYAEIIDILNGNNYDDFIVIDDTVIYSNGDYAFDSSVESDNTPAFAHLLDAQEPTNPTTRIMNLLDIDEVTAMQMITVFGDAELALEEAELYKSLKNIYYTLNYDSVKDYLTSLVVNGYGAQRVAMSYIVADALGEDILDVMITEYPEEEIDDEFVEILVYDYYVSPEFIYSYLEENDMTAEIMYTAIFSTFKVLYPDTLPSTFYTEVEDETTQYPTAPFYAHNSESEYVSPSSGQLFYQLDLATVSGINGMDINLLLKYNSGTSAVLGDMKTETTTVGRPIFDSNGNYISGVANVTVYTYYDDYNWSEKSPFIFGSGWRLNFDYIKTVDEDKFLVLTDGNEYKINLQASGNKLFGHNCDALTFTEDNGSYNSNSKYKLVFSDGTTEYFDAKGDLLAIIDRFGNGITFTKSTINETVVIDGSSVTFTNELKISNDEDVDVDDIVIKYNLTKQIIILPDGSMIHFNYTYTDEGYQLTTVKNQAGETTTFAYELMQGGKKDYADPNNVNNLYAKAGYTFERPYHHLISEITYPTGAKVEYTYASRQTNEVIQACVTNRKNVIGTDISNTVSYTYHENSLSMNKADYGNRVVEYEYNIDGYVSKEITKVGDSVKSWISKTYHWCGKPSRVEYVETASSYMTLLGYQPVIDQYGNVIGSYPIYDTSYISNVSTYNYNSKGYVTSSTENGLTKTYTYDSTYYLPLSVTYTRDDNVKVKHQYYLSGDKKKTMLDMTIVNDSGVYAQRYYEYDACGNVIKERAYKNNSDYVETAYTYDNAGRLTSQTTAGVTLNYTYDAMGRVTAETNGIGGTTSYVYDSMGRVIEVKHPDDTHTNRSHITTSYTVSNTENSITETDEVGNVTKYNYDALGNIVSVYVGNTLVERYEYDEYSRVSRKFDSQNNYTTYTYDHAGRTTAVNVYAPDSEVAEYQETYAYEAIAADNLLKTTKTVVGELNAPSIVTLTYTDVYGRVVKEGYKVGASERLTTYTYDNCGNKTSELSALDAQNGYAFTNQYVYDFNNRVVRQINALGESAYTEYDWLGNALRKIDNNNNVTTLIYDAFGRVLTQITPFDTTTSTKIVYTYDNLGNVTEEKTLSVSSDNTETLLRKTGYEYDLRGNLLKVKSYTSANDHLVTAVYTYDKKGQMLTSTAGDYTTQYAYDAYGNVSRITYPGGGYETFTYLPNGNLLSSTDRSGVTTTYTYNALGNPLTVTAGTGTNAKTISYTYAKTGAVLSESNSTATTSYTYDAMGRVVTEGAASYTYDLNGNITSVTTGGRVVSYTYDRLNRMVSATEGNITAVYGYDTNGNRTSTVISVGGTTAAQTTYTYNLAGLATTLVNKNGAGSTLSSFTYTYAADGNILTEVANTGTTKTTNYTYDLLGRLICESGKHYEYDVAGNRAKVIIDTTTKIEYTYNNDGELISETSTVGTVSEVTTYTYDANGNLTKKTKGISVTNYGYDVWGNMVSADNATYAYNAQGLRVSKSVGNATTNFLLVGGNVWSDGTTNYTRGIELISNGTQLYLYNVRGDVIQLLGFDGDVDKTYDYDAYGNEYARDLGDSNPFRYCGEYYDTETGFIYLRARYYDPATGRFVAMDTHWNPSNAIYGDNPVKTSSAEDCKSLYPNINAIKQSSNTYIYCTNNPIAYKDTNGRWIHLAVGALVGGIWGAVEYFVNNTNKEFNPVEFGVEVLTGALGGLLASTTAGWLVQIVANTLIGGAKEIIKGLFGVFGDKDSSNNSVDFDNVDWKDVGKGVISGLAGGLAGGPGGGSKHLDNLSSGFFKRIGNAFSHKSGQSLVKELSNAFSYFTKSSSSLIDGICDSIDIASVVNIIMGKVLNVF